MPVDNGGPVTIGDPVVGPSGDPEAELPTLTVVELEVVAMASVEALLLLIWLPPGLEELKLDEGAGGVLKGTPDSVPLDDPVVSVAKVVELELGNVAVSEPLGMSEPDVEISDVLINLAEGVLELFSTLVLLTAGVDELISGSSVDEAVPDPLLDVAYVPVPDANPVELLRGNETVDEALETEKAVPEDTVVNPGVVEREVSGEVSIILDGYPVLTRLLVPLGPGEVELVGAVWELICEAPVGNVVCPDGYSLVDPGTEADGLGIMDIPVPENKLDGPTLESELLVIGNGVMLLAVGALVVLLLVGSALDNDSEPGVVAELGAMDEVLTAVAGGSAVASFMAEEVLVGLIVGMEEFASGCCVDSLVLDVKLDSEDMGVLISPADVGWAEEADEFVSGYEVVSLTLGELMRPVDTGTGSDVDTMPGVEAAVSLSGLLVGPAVGTDVFVSEGADVSSVLIEIPDVVGIEADDSVTGVESCVEAETSVPVVELSNPVGPGVLKVELERGYGVDDVVLLLLLGPPTPAGKKPLCGLLLVPVMKLALVMDAWGVEVVKLDRGLLGMLLVPVLAGLNAKLLRPDVELFSGYEAVESNSEINILLVVLPVVGSVDVVLEGSLVANVAAASESVPELGDWVSLADVCSFDMGLVTLPVKEGMVSRTDPGVPFERDAETVGEMLWESEVLWMETSVVCGADGDSVATELLLCVVVAVVGVVDCVELTVGNDVAVEFEALIEVTPVPVPWLVVQVEFLNGKGADVEAVRDADSLLWLVVLGETVGALVIALVSGSTLWLLFTAVLVVEKVVDCVTEFGSEPLETDWFPWVTVGLVTEDMPMEDPNVDVTTPVLLLVTENCDVVAIDMFVNVRLPVADTLLKGMLELPVVK
ncbi:hypothetical protein F4861DRAFT_549521 [Xylaria intraflava]|nr:hypothetical protein F4861DRAFT_549521 [Xylaria intraflava]